MFKIENPIDAYFLGWLYSDGGIHYSESAYSYCTKIKLKSLKEEQQLEFDIKEENNKLQAINLKKV